MFHRIVVILTILAVIACPLFCGKGTACCLDDHHSQTHASATQPKCSCCCHTSDQPQEDPGDDPEGSDELCQGICGGVVMLESVKLETRDDLLHAVPFEVVAVQNGPAETVFEQPAEFAAHESPSGRSLRTLLSSYLC